MFTIEKNVSVDLVRKRISWPWKSMSVGDSVFIDKDIAARAQINCHVYGRGQYKKFATRAEGDGLRVWRIE